MAARKKNTSRKTRRKGGGFTLPRTAPTPDSLFTMVLSCHQFFYNNFKEAGLKLNSKKLMTNLLTAMENTVADKATPTHKPEYNVAADALAAAYLAHINGDKKNSREMVRLAFASPDCNLLMDSLAALNTDAEGLVPPPDFMTDDFEPGEAGNTEGKPVLPEAKIGALEDPGLNETGEGTGAIDVGEDSGDALNEALDQSGGDEDADEDHGAENSPTEDRILASRRLTAKKFMKNIKRVVKTLSESDFGDDDGELLTTLQGTKPGTMTMGIPSGNAKKGAGDDGDESNLPDPNWQDLPSTMRTGDLEMPEAIEPFEWAGDYNRVSLLSDSAVKKLVKTQPELIAIANKISGLGSKRGHMLAKKFIDNIYGKISGKAA